jgi:hypothetical protein
MKISDLAKTAKYIGCFDVTETEINWTPELRWSDYRNMGNVVYFMFVKDQLMKIGIAGGAGGWNGRVGMYRNGTGPGGDGTNARILRVMKEIGETHIDIYAVSCPKQKISFTCPLTGDIIEDKVEVHRLTEQYLTRRYLTESENHQLLFSNQLN